jgi:rubrerythrin
MTLDHLLRLAYSAERAAAFAYQGHARSVRDPEEKARIHRIEQEEWEHRVNILRMLERRSLAPSTWLELKYAIIGTAISWSCLLIGYFMPMYFAGRLESGNVNEYITMAALASDSNLADERECILEMARVEKDHEMYFLSRIRGHRWMAVFQRVFTWGPERSFNALTWEDRSGRQQPVSDASARHV